MHDIIYQIKMPYFSLKYSGVRGITVALTLVMLPTSLLVNLA